MKRASILLASILIASAAGAQDKSRSANPAPPKPVTENPAPETPVTEKDVSAGDVVATPVTDLNLKKGEIPQVLLDAQDDPYSLAGLSSCSRLGAAVSEFDAVLGEDFDIAAQVNHKPQAGRVAQSVVGSFIPFRGIIREISGANAQQRKLQEAIVAGSARRGFLKGVGQQRGCRYPARPATPEIAARRLAEIAAADPKNKDKQAAAAEAAADLRATAPPPAKKQGDRH